MMRILAGISVYEAEREKLLENVLAIIGQTDGLLLVDNGSSDTDDLEKWLTEKLAERLTEKREEDKGEIEETESAPLLSKLHWLKNSKNLGLARALNQMFEYAGANAYDWVLTLDQDSVCPPNMIREYKKYQKLPRLGILSPLLLDRNYDRVAEHQGETELLMECITSGAFSPVKAWEDAGGFFDALFIDYVDYDFSARLREAGYRIYRINSVHMLHELGRGENHSFFGKQITVLNHAPLRHYYIIRNWIYYMEMHKAVIDYRYEKKKYLFHYIKTLLYEEEKLAKWKQMRKGRADAKALIKAAGGKIKK